MARHINDEGRSLPCDATVIACKYSRHEPNVVYDLTEEGDKDKLLQVETMMTHLMFSNSNEIEVSRLLDCKASFNEDGAYVLYDEKGNEKIAVPAATRFGRVSFPEIFISRNRHKPVDFGELSFQ